MLPADCLGREFEFKFIDRPLQISDRIANGLLLSWMRSLPVLQLLQLQQITQASFKLTEAVF